MLSASEAVKRRVRQNTALILRADITFSSGERLRLSGDDFIDGTASFTSSTSSCSNFDIGAAIIGKFSVTLNNWDRRFDLYDFTNAIIEPYVGVVLEDDTEWIKKGVYNVEKPDTYGNTIGIECVDNLSLFEKPYSLVNTTYPATLQTIVADICEFTNVVLLDSKFSNYDFVAVNRPSEEKITCLSVLSYAAQAAGCFVRVDPYGCIGFEWYDKDELIKLREASFDGGTFGEINEFGLYGDGDYVDGGNFRNYADAWSVDGGNFIFYGNFNKEKTISAISSLQMCTDETIVTGVKVSTEGQEVLCGEDGYVIAVDKNPLIGIDQLAQQAEFLASKSIGLIFRTFSASVLGNPLAEAGDAVALIDRRGTRFASLITNQTFKIGAYQSIACEATPPVTGGASSSNSAATKAYLKASTEIAYERQERKIAIDQLISRVDAITQPKKFSNSDIETMIGSVASLLDRTDILGYAANRNTRALSNEIQDYTAIKTKLLMQYGEEIIDESGNPTGIYEVSSDNPNFDVYTSEVSVLASIEHAPAIFAIPYESCVGLVSEECLSAIEWMITEGGV